MLHSWQVPSAVARLDLTEVLIHDIDMDPILDQVARASELAAFSPQAGPYHDGRWQRVGLVAPSGDPARSYPKKGERVEKTPVLKALPALEAIIDRFDGEIRAASLSKMEPGAHVRWHIDGRQSIDLAYARLHLPLVTSPAATMRLGHQTLHLSAGQLWYSDFTFPHDVTNGGAEARVHLMFDVAITPALLRLVPERQHLQRRRRGWARRAATRIFNLRERIHPEGRRALKARAERTRAMAEPNSGS